MVSFVKKYRIKNFKKMTAILLAIKNFFQRLFFFFFNVKNLVFEEKRNSLFVHFNLPLERFLRNVQILHFLEEMFCSLGSKGN